MEKGFYKATYESELAVGVGLTFVLDDGTFVGGDLGFYFRGRWKYENDDTTVTATVYVDPNIDDHDLISVSGQRHARIVLKGKEKDDSIILNPVDNDAIGLRVTLQFLHAFEDE